MLSYAISLYLCLMSSKALSTTKTSFPGAIFTKENSRLKGYSFKWHVTPSQISCTQACFTNPRCYSTKFKKIEYMVPDKKARVSWTLNTHLIWEVWKRIYIMNLEVCTLDTQETTWWVWHFSFIPYSCPFLPFLFIWASFSGPFTFP